jgi:hypothetical protein
MRFLKSLASVRSGDSLWIGSEVSLALFAAKSDYFTFKLPIPAIFVAIYGSIIEKAA